MATATRTRAPAGKELDGKLDEAFGPVDVPAVTPPTERPATFDEALAWLQQHLPRVGLDADGELKFTDKAGNVTKKAYRYADLADVSEAILPLLGSLGLSWRCRPTLTKLDGEAAYRFVLAYRLRHIDGNEEAGVWPLPDRADPQVVGSHITYGRRYCLCAVTGLAPGGDDEDGGRAASDASRRSDTLTEASLSLPPAESERLVAALEPAAETPLEEYPKLWEIVVKRRAAAKESPIEHDSTRLTWAQLFGFSLAQRVEALTPLTYRGLWDQAKALGDARLPWQWEGRNVGAALKLRQTQLADEQRQYGEVLALAIASAETDDQLTSAGHQLAQAKTEKTVTDQRHGELLRSYDERVAALARGSAQRAAEPPPESATPTYPWAKSPKTFELITLIWTGTTFQAVLGELDAAWTERGEISADEHALLSGMVRGRPEPITMDPTDAAAIPPLVVWLEWQIATATDEARLDAVRDRVAKLNSTGVLPGGPGSTVQRLYGLVGERRKLMTGGRYR